MKRAYKILIIVGMAFGVLATTLIVGVGQTMLLMSGSRLEQGTDSRVYSIYQSSRKNQLEGMSLDMVGQIKEILPAKAIGSIESELFSPHPVRKGEEYLDARIFLTDENYLKVRPLTLLQGRFLSSEDIEHQRKVCVVHEAVHRLIGDPGVKKIHLGDEEFEIVGVVTSQKSTEKWAFLEVNYDKAVFVPVTSGYTYIEKLPFRSGIIQSVAVRVPAGMSMADIQRPISEWVSITPGAPPLKVGDPNERDRNRLLDNLKILSSILLVSELVLLVAGLNIIQLMSAKVHDMRKEIALRMALGATPKHILKEVTLEVLVCSLQGGYIGIVMSGLLHTALNRFMGRYWATFDIYTALLGVLLALITGLVTSLIPARLAAKVDPALTLRK